MGTMVTREERRWVLAYALILILVTAAPYLLAFANQGSDWRFSGFVFGVEDGNSYIAKMRTGAQGAWLFRSPYSTMPQRGVVAFLPYLLLGKLAAGEAMHEQLVVLFHLARLGAILLLVPVTYSFAARFLPSAGWRRIVTVLATAGGGLGWLAIVLGASYWMGSLPLDVISPESFGFLSVFGLPHLVLARALLLLGLLEYLRGSTGKFSRFRGAAAFLLMGVMQPISLVTAYALLGMHVALVWLTRRNAGEVGGWGRRALLSVSLSVPLFVYSLVAFSSDPFLVAWTAQNKILSPHPVHYLLAYGLVLLPAAAEAVRVLRERAPERLLLAGWLILLPFLAYFPHNLQRRLPEGVWVGLLVLAASWLGRWIGAQRERRLAVGTLLVASLATSALVWLGGIRTAMSPASPAFVPASEAKAFEWLAQNAVPGSVVLSDFPTGNALPAWAPVRVVIGHGPETIGLDRLREQVEAFLSSAGVNSQQALLQEQDVEVLFLRDDALDLAADTVWNGRRWVRVYDEASVRLYAVEE
jgi:hypothetical protein